MNRDDLTLESLVMIAHGIARQFGNDCEVCIHDLQANDLEHTICYIINGHVSGRKIGDGDYWVDDSNSAYYNTWVNTSKVKKDWASAEDLKAAYPFYNYALALNYNTEAVPGKGSAIFIHCTKTDNDTSSAGCIRIPEDYMKKLVNGVDANTKIVIIQNVDKLSSY